MERSGTRGWQQKKAEAPEGRPIFLSLGLVAGQAVQPPLAGLISRLEPYPGFPRPYAPLQAASTRGYFRPHLRCLAGGFLPAKDSPGNAPTEGAGAQCHSNTGTPEGVPSEG